MHKVLFGIVGILSIIGILWVGKYGSNQVAEKPSVALSVGQKDSFKHCKSNLLNITNSMKEHIDKPAFFVSMKINSICSCFVTVLVDKKTPKELNLSRELTMLDLQKSSEISLLEKSIESKKTSKVKKRNINRKLKKIRKSYDRKIRNISSAARLSNIQARRLVQQFKKAISSCDKVR